MEYKFKSPVNIGDDIYLLNSYCGKFYGCVTADKVQLVGFTKNNIHIKARNHHDHNKMYILGKNCFISIEEAEEKLKSAEKEGKIL